MKNLEQLKYDIQTLEFKAHVYFNELGDIERYNQLRDQIEALNDQILDLMTHEAEMQRFEAFIA